MRNILIFALLLIVAIGSAQDDKFRADQTFIEYTGKASDTICESGTWDREYLVNKDLPFYPGAFDMYRKGESFIRYG